MSSTVRSQLGAPPPKGGTPNGVDPQINADSRRFPGWRSVPSVRMGRPDLRRAAVGYVEIRVLQKSAFIGVNLRIPPAFFRNPTGTRLTTAETSRRLRDASKEDGRTNPNPTRNEAPASPVPFRGRPTKLHRVEGSSSSSNTSCSTLRERPMSKASSSANSMISATRARTFSEV